MLETLSGPLLQRARAPERIGRAIVAAVSGAAMMTGAYPFVPALIGARRRKQSLLGRVLRPEMAIEWGLSMAASAVRPLGYLGLPGNRVRGPRPVILIHGYAMARSCFLPMAARIARAGFGPVIGFEYWSLGSIAEASRRLGRVIDRALAVTGASEVDIVGHSLGGIVGRYFVCLDGGADRVRRLITLGSPHAGVELSMVSVGNARRELHRDSPTLARLSRAATPPDVALTIVCSPSDVLVGSSRHAMIEGAEAFRLDRLNHLAMLTDRRVARIVLERLGR